MTNGNDPIEEFPKKIKNSSFQTSIWKWCKNCTFTLEPDDLICIDCLQKTIDENNIINRPHSFEPYITEDVYGYPT